MSGAAGICLRTTIKNPRGTAGIGLITTIKYLRRTTSAAVGSSLDTTAKHLVNQNAGAGINLIKVFVVNSGPTPGHVRRFVCAWGPGLLAVFINVV
jgi:hypothetical protein